MEHLAVMTVEVMEVAVEKCCFTDNFLMKLFLRR